MPSRVEIHQNFVTRFHSGKRPKRASAKQLDAVEKALKTKLPNAFREFMLRHGAVYTPDILDEIVDNDLDHPDLQNVFDPKEAIAGTKGCWSAGMPEDVIGIASDCMGNTIGFRRQAKTSDDAPVVLFDHDMVDVSAIARSFDKFLAWYLKHLKGKQANA